MGQGTCSLYTSVILELKKCLSSKCEKVIKNKFRILKKTHAYLQTILKAHVKFQKDRIKPVGGVKGTKYLLKIRNHAPRATHHTPRATHYAPRTTHQGKPKTVFLRFSSKRRGTKKLQLLQHRWLVYSGWFKHVFKALGNSSDISRKQIFRNILGKVSYFIMKIYVVNDTH